MSYRRLDVLSPERVPVQVVWELTRRCDAACAHCGSRAGKARDNELGTEEALRVARELGALGAREVTLIGGEAYLHPGFLEIAAALAAAGIVVVLVTGGRGVTRELAAGMRAAGLVRVSVSLDGLAAAHDRLRGREGSFALATRALRHAREAGLGIVANTTVNRANLADLEGLYEHLRAEGVAGWQVQLTTPAGRAADRPEALLMPWDLLDLVPRLAALKRRGFAEGMSVMPGDNLGYFGPEEALLRSPAKGGTDHWAGCQAGHFVMGIASNGAIKGCASLPTPPERGAEGFTGGNVRERPLREIWSNGLAGAFGCRRSVEELWGFCRTCAFGEVCLGGCSFTAHAVHGRLGNDPYCHYRARTLAKRGLRERLVPAAAESEAPFEVVVEPLDAPDPWAAGA